MNSNVGLIGLGTMGKAFARNIASRGFKVSLWNRTQEKIHNFVSEFGEESYYAPKSFEDFIESLEKPRKVILLVPAGNPTTEMLKRLGNVLEEDDVIMDGGNALFKVTEVFQNQLLPKGIHFLGCGVSGGEEGALKGPSIMPGGTRHAWEAFEPILSAAAAEDFNGKACVAYMGRGGAGHYIKMVHNGIEYAEMQMLAEAYLLLKSLYKLTHTEIADIFETWNNGRMASFLTEISIDILRKKEDGHELLDLILDKAKQKGTGQWTSQEALRLGVPTFSITGAVFMRGLSSQKTTRMKLAELYPKNSQSPNMLLSEFTEHLEKALYASRISNFEQGLALLRAADEDAAFGFNFPETIRIWQGGCIIRCAVLKEIYEALSQKNESLYFADFAHAAIVDAQKSWRLVVSTAVEHSVPMNAISTALTHFEGYRQGRGSANFIQGLRDRFGSHTYERIDQDGQFHSDWS